MLFVNQVKNYKTDEVGENKRFAAIYQHKATPSWKNKEYAHKKGSSHSRITDKSK